MSVIVEKNIDAKMRDGTVLRADIYRPADGGRYPVLVQRTPYNKEFWPFTAAGLDPIKAAGAGYVVVIQDVRARWASDGDVFYFYRNEFEDGYDTVEWAADLPWSDGNVGAYGISYMGGSTWAAASQAPPHLKAIAPTTAPESLYGHVWPGGALLWGTVVSWSLQGIGPNALARSKLGSEDFLPLFLQLVDDIDNYEEVVRHMPLKTLPAGRFEDPTFLPFFREMLEHPTPDKYNAGVLSCRYEQVKAPAQIIAGWYDLLLNNDIAHFQQMRSSAATKEARENTRLIIGPWSHGTFLNVVGELDFGLRAAGIFMDLKEDLTGLHLRWFDRWLKGIPTGIDDEAPVKIFVQGINRWRDENEWPLTRAVSTPWFLHPEGGLDMTAPSGGNEPDEFVYDPQDPVPTRGGNLLLPASYPRGPVDQAPIIARPDVLSYTSEPFGKDVEITGPVSAVLYAATSARDTDWVVKLCDVHPDARSFNICDGVLRARYREGLGRPKLVEPETVQKYEIDLWATSIVIKAGHRLRVLVTSSDFPRYDRNPNTGELGVDAKTTQPARQRIFHDSEHPSHLILPIVAN